MTDQTSSEFVLTARWVFPVTGPPLDNGTVTVRGKRIAAVEPRGSRSADFDYGNSAIIPGLVNAHTHLDLSGARGLLPPGRRSPIDWLREVIAFRLRQTSPASLDAIRVGLDECLRCGTTLLGDIAAGGASWELLCAAPLRSVIFHELIGLSAERSAAAVDGASAFAEKGSDRCRPGLSPHAPYSFRFEALQRLADSDDVLLSIHLAEFREEMELLETKRGPFVSFLTERGAWDATGLAPSAEAILRSCDRKRPVSFVHGNYLPANAPVPRNGAIVYCPRTHAAFGHPGHPFRDFLRRGVRVALGTDSLASNPDLDVLAEARFLAERYPDLAGNALLRMITLSGAEALGWAAETGSLSAGKSADLVVIPLPDQVTDDPHELLFRRAEPARSLRQTMWCGSWRPNATSPA